MIEYAKDLISYSEDGPAPDPCHQINKRVQCPSVRDMVQHLSASGGPRVTAYFSHSSGILLHLTAMGAFAQGPSLTAHYFEGRKDREWNTSKLSPMAANIVAILYKNHKVKFFLNDKVVHLPGCNKGLCDVASLKSKFSQCY